MGVAKTNRFAVLENYEASLPRKQIQEMNGMQMEAAPYECPDQTPFYNYRYRGGYQANPNRAPKKWMGHRPSLQPQNDVQSFHQYNGIRVKNLYMNEGRGLQRRNSKFNSGFSNKRYSFNRYGQRAPYYKTGQPSSFVKSLQSQMDNPPYYPLVNPGGGSRLKSPNYINGTLEFSRKASPNTENGGYYANSKYPKMPINSGYQRSSAMYQTRNPKLTGGSAYSLPRENSCNNYGGNKSEMFRNDNRRSNYERNDYGQSRRENDFSHRNYYFNTAKRNFPNSTGMNQYYNPQLYQYNASPWIANNRVPSTKTMQPDVQFMQDGWMKYQQPMSFKKSDDLNPYNNPYDERPNTYENIKQGWMSSGCPNVEFGAKTRSPLMMGKIGETNLKCPPNFYEKYNAPYPQSEAQEDTMHNDRNMIKKTFTKPTHYKFQRQESLQKSVEGRIKGCKPESQKSSEHKENFGNEIQMMCPFPESKTTSLPKKCSNEIDCCSMDKLKTPSKLKKKTEEVQPICQTLNIPILPCAKNDILSNKKTSNNVNIVTLPQIIVVGTKTSKAEDYIRKINKALNAESNSEDSEDLRKPVVKRPKEKRERTKIKTYSLCDDKKYARYRKTLYSQPIVASILVKEQSIASKAEVKPSTSFAQEVKARAMHKKKKEEKKRKQSSSRIDKQIDHREEFDNTEIENAETVTEEIQAINLKLKKFPLIQSEIKKSTSSQSIMDYTDVYQMLYNTEAPEKLTKSNETCLTMSTSDVNNKYRDRNTGTTEESRAFLLDVESSTKPHNDESEDGSKDEIEKEELVPVFSQMKLEVQEESEQTDRNTNEQLNKPSPCRIVSEVRAFVIPASSILQMDSKDVDSEEQVVPKSAVNPPSDMNKPKRRSYMKLRPDAPRFQPKFETSATYSVNNDTIELTRPNKTNVSEMQITKPLTKSPYNSKINKTPESSDGLRSATRHRATPFPNTRTRSQFLSKGNVARRSKTLSSVLCQEDESSSSLEFDESLQLDDFPKLIKVPE